MILVTGGSGLLGKELIAQIVSRGEKVKAIYHKTPLADFPSSLVESIPCNILDVMRLEEVFAGVQQVYHCAGLVSFNRKDRQQLANINITGTANIVNAALDARVKKMVYVSSVAALERSSKGILLTEKKAWDETNKSHYAKSKFMAELEVWRGMAEGMDIAVVNPSVILGAGDWNKGSTQIFKTIYDGFDWYSEGINGFVDARDVARAMILLMDSNISGERFILNADNFSYKTIFELIAEGFKKKAPSKKVTPLMAQLYSRWAVVKSILTGEAPLVTRETSQTAMSKTYYDNSKLKNAFPEFQYTPIEKTIADTCVSLLGKYNH